MAISLETDAKYHLSYSTDVEFPIAAQFAVKFARMLLEKKFPADVHLLKVEVPADAAPDTPWQLTRVSQQRYYAPVPAVRKSWDEPGTIGYKEEGAFDNEPEDTDVFVLRKKRMVSVTPMSFDLTSRVDFAELDKLMRK